MSEVVTRHRTPSPGLLAFRSERKLMAPVRREISHLQHKAAFIAARQTSSRPLEPAELEAEVSTVCEAIDNLHRQIHELMGSAKSVGPATDCSSALEHVRARLPIG